MVADIYKSATKRMGAKSLGCGHTKALPRCIDCAADAIAEVRRLRDRLSSIHGQLGVRGDEFVDECAYRLNKEHATAKADNERLREDVGQLMYLIEVAEDHISLICLTSGGGKPSLRKFRDRLRAALNQKDPT